jgi:hypothetical protein
MSKKLLVMKLALIYNVWDDWDLFRMSYQRTAPLADGVIVVASEKSNFGEVSEIPDFTGWPINLYKFEPLAGDARDKETAKRNFGLDKARELGFTHFLMMDADEFYEPEEFLKEKKRLENPKLLGLVCRVKCYFKSPTLTIGYDTTLVPFIHKITPTLRFEFNKNYPFAWTFIDGIPFTHSKKIRIDPTRSMNINDDVEWSEITMHHMSWVRKDVKKKIRNSTARQNIEKSTIVQDYVNAKEGYFCEFYSKTLERSPNIFGLPEYEDTSL